MLPVDVQPFASLAPVQSRQKKISRASSARSIARFGPSLFGPLTADGISNDL